MYYDALWREERDNLMKMNEESRASSGVDPKERESPEET